ncbi:PPIC-type PPIASE domain protein [Prochlorococcus marinus str. MIT 1313]|uniref:peptidylprolyl isomerase n=1 Tax=Prochlorococcus TaxID=1218 RepID=UPI0007B3A9B7|nr:peptidylprolyl isomerase [Prochlorococcus marinus]KZR72337.1 PPIC-type PPIASE domain protein [Prochlorococcus marinus str. MIT 1313]KZR74070.1 PPIC-type PPIASE domain protein [Prochlorococcus marinus str. MIT 1318]
MSIQSFDKQGYIAIQSQCSWQGPSPAIPPELDEVGRWRWPELDTPSFQLMKRTGRTHILLTAWLEDLIAALVPLSQQLCDELGDEQSCRQERLRLFRNSAFSLHVEEHFSRTKRQRDRIIFSMLRCSSLPRIEELALAIREGEMDFAAAAIRFSEGPESAQGGRVGPIHPNTGNAEVNSRLEQANEGDLIGPLLIDNSHILLRLDTRITTRFNEQLQEQLINELYQEWLASQLTALQSGESIEPPEYLPSL